MGTKSTQSFVVGHDSDADLRTTAAGIRTGLLAVGALDNGDSGQINTSTATRNASTGGLSGYQVFKLGDNGGAYQNYIMRINYRAGDAVNSALKLEFVFGRATDGAGNFTSGSATINQQQSSNGNTGTMNHYFCGDGSDFRMLIANGLEGYGFYLSVARTKDPTTGLKDNRGLSVIHRGDTTGGANSTGANQGQLLMMADGNVPYNTTALSCGAQRGNTGSDGYGLSVYPVWEPTGGSQRWDMTTLAYFLTDYNAPLSSIDIPSVYGATHTYLVSGFLPIKGANQFAQSLNGNLNYHGVMMLWE